MPVSINDVIDKLKDNRYISISLIQSEMSIGFLSATKLFNQLKEEGYLIENPSNKKYSFNKEKLPSHNGIKIIFLDIDGVLNCRSTKDTCIKYVGIEDKKVSLLKEIVDRTDSKIVLVSSWKFRWYKESFLKDEQDELANYLDDKLSKQGLSIYDKTLDYDCLDRGEGTLEYIAHLKRKGIEVDSYVIIDDELFDYKKTKLTKRLIQTSYDKDGLNHRHVKKAIMKLMEVY